MTKRRYRTKEENEALVLQVYERIAKGSLFKEVVYELQIPHVTLRKIVEKYYHQHGYKTLCQAVIAHALEVRCKQNQPAA